MGTRQIRSYLKAKKQYTELAAVERLCYETLHKTTDRTMAANERFHAAWDRLSDYEKRLIEKFGAR